MYNKAATFFDLINGGREPKQTKGLALALSKDVTLRNHFLEHPTVRKAIVDKTKSKLSLNKITFVEVAAEAPTTRGLFADIVIKIDVDNKPFVALIIEAKSLNVRANSAALANQISGYLNYNSFPLLKNYPLVGIVLTRHRQFLPGIESMLWEDIVQMTANACKSKSHNITKDYFTFLTGIQTMKFYEEEVLSVAAGATINLVQQHQVYVCPDTPAYNYRKSIFMAFRAQQGIMKDLYRVLDVVIINPLNPGELRAFQNSSYDQSMKQQILNYIAAAPSRGNTAAFTNTPQRFYVLDASTIPLPNAPRPKRNNPGARYYCLHDILTKKVVTPCSTSPSSTPTKPTRSASGGGPTRAKKGS